MIDREKLNKILEARDTLEGIARVEITIYKDGDFRLWVTPLLYSETFSEETRHKVLSELTPLVGKLTLRVIGTDKDYSGSGNGISIYVNRADVCKIVGYRKKIKTVRKEIERPVEYEEVEEEVEVPITDCEIKQGLVTEDQIEVKA